MKQSTKERKKSPFKEIKDKFLQSYLYTDNSNYFISTIYRRSSSIMGGWYYETFAWKLDDKNERTDWVEDNSGAISEKGAIKQHIEVIEKLSKLQGVAK